MWICEVRKNKKKFLYFNICITLNTEKNVASKALIISEGYIDRSKYIFAKVRNSNLYSKKLFLKLVMNTLKIMVSFYL